MPAEARVISRAVVSNTPSFPKKLPVVLIAALSTLVLSMGFVTAAELLSGSARGHAPSTGRFDRREPLLAGAAGWNAASDAESAAAIAASESDLAICGLAKVIVDAGDAKRRVTVLGLKRDIGITSTAVALARALAGSGKVVVVDLALAGPSLAAMSIDPGAPGITDLLRGTASFRHVITRDRYSSAHLIGGGRTVEEGAEILSSERLAIALSALSRSYEYLILDGGALAQAPLARLARLAPEAVLVAPDAAKDVAAAAYAQLTDAGFTGVTVLTEPSPRLDEIADAPSVVAA